MQRFALCGVMAYNVIQQAVWGLGMQDEVLDVEAVAAWLDIGVNLVRKLAFEGKIPARKVGREWRFSKRALLAWLESWQASHGGRWTEE